MATTVAYLYFNQSIRPTFDKIMKVCSVYQINYHLNWKQFYWKQNCLVTLRPMILVVFPISPKMLSIIDLIACKPYWKTNLTITISKSVAQTPEMLASGATLHRLVYNVTLKLDIFRTILNIYSFTVWYSSKADDESLVFVALLPFSVSYNK